MYRQLLDDERRLMTHVMMFGSDGYPIRKQASRWTWGGWGEIKGPPTVFRTKREAVESFERYLDVLHDLLRDERLAQTGGAS